MTLSLRSVHRSIRGFTLLEILVTLIVASILSAMLIQFLGSGMTRSTQPVIMAQRSLTLNQLLELMQADYHKLLVTDPTPLDTFKTHVEGGNIDTNVPYFGSYTPQTAYIVLTGGNEAPDTSGEDRVLKVTITVQNHSLTALFTE
jgi:prepilin-type N-terminal cleavage/methylation domain-containing protein